MVERILGCSRRKELDSETRARWRGTQAVERKKLLCTLPADGWFRETQLCGCSDNNLKGDCEDCGRQGDVLTYLRATYPTLRVYSFDYNLELGALKTLVNLNQINGYQLPSMVIGGKAPVYGFKNLQDMEKLVPELKTLATSTEQTATTSTR